MEIFAASVGTMPALSANPAWLAAALAVRFRRLAGLRSSSRWSQRRMVSRPISIPSSRRPSANVSGELPASCSRSNSARCGSNFTVAWLRGWRACSTAWAKVVGRGVVDGEYTGSVILADGDWYEQCVVSARVSAWCWSKRQRLDVGVYPNCFVFILADGFSDFSDYFVDLSFDWLSSPVGELLILCSCILGELSEWVSSVVLSDSSDGFSGGVGC